VANINPVILILSGVQGDPRRYRTFHLYEQARLAGLSCQLSHVTDRGLREKATEATIIILHRAAYDDQVAWIEHEIHQKHGRLIADMDDLVFDPEAVQYIHSPDFGDPVRRSLYLEDVKRFRQTLEGCDNAIVSSDFLSERVHQLGKPASIHRNAFSLEMLFLSEQAYRRRNENPARVVLGYASGTPTHDQDFALIKPVLKSILSSHAEAELWLVGRVNPGDDWEEGAGRVKKMRRVPWRGLPEIQAQFDINLAPLVIDNPFGQSKSEIKYVEAALVRVPTIASPSDSYMCAVQDGENGMLAEEPGEWRQDLETLISQPELRKTLGETAYHAVLQHYHPRVRARQLVETLNHIADDNLERAEDPNPSAYETPGEFWSCASYEKSPTLIERGMYTIKYRSMRTLFRQIWIYVRRLVSPIIPYPKPR
jgi:glycosyltransferase involved in cell wall biosynthesis